MLFTIIKFIDNKNVNQNEYIVTPLEKCAVVENGFLFFYILEVGAGSMAWFEPAVNWFGNHENVVDTWRHVNVRGDCKNCTFSLSMRV